MNVYCNALSACLPNAPVPNEAIEDVLGKIGGQASRTRAIILRNNKIKSRHYAIDPVTKAFTHTNAQLAAEAVRKLAPRGGWSLEDIDCLCSGSSSPDLISPGLASMVHGELKTRPLETASAAGICLSGLTAFKYAAMSVALGSARHAVSTGSELASARLRASFFKGHSLNPDDPEAVEKAPQLGFDADFLRWMLSDAAGAALLEPAPRPGGLSLKVEWMEHLSYAHQLDTCMYIGGRKEADGSMTGWHSLPSMQQVFDQDLLAVRQDVELLNREIVPTCVNLALVEVLKRHPIEPKAIDWFLPHYSSNYFRDRLHDAMQGIGFGIPYERWFTNLETKGNTGAASIYVIMEELLHSGRLKEGQQLLCFVPESGRFSVGYMLMRVVAA